MDKEIELDMLHNDICCKRCYHIGNLPNCYCIHNTYLPDIFELDPYEAGIQAAEKTIKDVFK